MKENILVDKCLFGQSGQFVQAIDIVFDKPQRLQMT